jgi:aryl-alcohol dehydrogenase-like predicted oxidoreductase
MAPDRRDFLRGVATGALALGTGKAIAQEAPAEEVPKGKVDQREFGTSGRKVSIFGLGLGSAFTQPYAKDHETGQKLLLRALEHGINYWDTARAYGPSEQIIGPVVKDVRDRIFLVSKTGDRTYDGFMRELETSLRNLQTDHLDLYHLHNFDPKRDKDLGKIENGAVKAARKAKEEGIIGHFGVTGHTDPGILMECIKRFGPDAILTIFPAGRPSNGRYEDELLPLALEKKVVVIAMKALRRARESDLKPTDLIRYTMSTKGITTAIVGLDTAAHVDENALLATDFKPLKNRQRAAISRQVQLALGNYPAPWDMPGYRDGAIV